MGEAAISGTSGRAILVVGMIASDRATGRFNERLVGRSVLVNSDKLWRPSIDRPTGRDDLLRIVRPVTSSRAINRTVFWFRNSLLHVFPKQ